VSAENFYPRHGEAKIDHGLLVNGFGQGSNLPNLERAVIGWLEPQFRSPPASLSGQDTTRQKGGGETGLPLPSSQASYRGVMMPYERFNPAMESLREIKVLCEWFK
jgi:hypothetical protein